MRIQRAVVGIVLFAGVAAACMGGVESDAAAGAGGGAVYSIAVSGAS